MTTKVVIIGKSNVIRLCTARAVALAGYSVDIIRIGRKKGKYLKTPDYFSKYVDNYYYFDETGNVSLSVFLIERYKGLTKKPVLFTLSDSITHLIDENASSLYKHFLFAHLKDGNSLSKLMNKHCLKTEAESVGFSVVKGWPIVYENGKFVIPDDITYPCFVKGLYSFWGSKKIQKKCNSLNELTQLVNTCKLIYPHSLYVEEYINIEKEVGIIGVSDGDHCIIPAETELIIMGTGESHGVSILGHVKPIEKDSKIKCLIEKLIRKLGYVGIFNIDFIIANNSYLFVELNLRFATYGYCVLKADVNLPALFINILNETVGDLKSKLLKKDYYYLNEEVALSNIVENKLSIKEYKRLKSKADVLIVGSSDDPAPRRRLIVFTLIRFICVFFKRIKKHFG